MKVKRREGIIKKRKRERMSKFEIPKAYHFESPRLLVAKSKQAMILTTGAWRAGWRRGGQMSATNCDLVVAAHLLQRQDGHHRHDEDDWPQGGKVSAKNEQGISLSKRQITLPGFAERQTRGLKWSLARDWRCGYPTTARLPGFIC